jgi:hypothetical protein
MNALRQEKLSLITSDKISKSAQIFQFPNQKSKPSQELKVASMACHRCEMKDWDFSRGW